uniref:Uncharacterized protein n=1 Tax=Rhizophora mucronata TaxID=61149 RepID=A0A2P2LCK5_RHIMU
MWFHLQFFLSFSISLLMFAACYRQWVQEHDYGSPRYLGNRSSNGRSTVAT